MNGLSDCEEKEMVAYGDGYEIGRNEMLREIAKALDSEDPLKAFALILHNNGVREMVTSEDTQHDA